MIDQTQQFLSELAACETALAREKIQHATASGEFKKEVLEFERVLGEKNDLIDALLAAAKLAEATLLKIRATKEEMPFKIDAVAALGKVIAKVKSV